MKQDVIIVGAGPGGLASAMLLAGAGLRVTVLEQKPRVGGRTAAHEADGFRFDTGPTFFLYPQILREIFAAIGEDLDDEVDLIRLDPQYRLTFGSGGEIDCTPRLDEMKRQIARLSPHDADGLEPFLADNRRKLDAFTPILQSSFASWRDVARLDLLKILPLLRPTRSVERDLGSYFEDPRVRLAFCFQSKYLGMSPFRCPSLFSILSFLEYEHGVFHPRGGCAAVMEGMARVAERHGAEIRLGEPVNELLFDGRRVTGVETWQGRYEADAVIVNADFAHAMEHLVPNELRRRWTDERIAKKKFSCSTFMMYLGVDGLYEDLPHHSIFIAEDYEQNLQDIEQHHRLSRDPSVYVQNACVTDPGLAPAGQSTLYVLAPVSHQHPNVDWETETPVMRQRVMQQLEKLGLRDLESRIRYERIVTPQHWELDYSVYKGATFNLAHSLDQMLHLRPRNRFEDLDGVYLVGGGTHPGSGLPVIFESARISSRLLAADLGLESAWPTSLPEYELRPELLEAV